MNGCLKYSCSLFVPIELSIDSIGDIVLALVNTGWIYFPLIKYCILVLTDPNHLSSLALCLEEHSGLKGETPEKNVSDNPSMDSFTKIYIDSEKL